MNWLNMLGVTCVIALIALYDWPKLKKKPWKDKLAFITAVTAAWGMAYFFNSSYNPPGPDQWVNSAFRPLGQWLSSFRYQGM